MFFLPRDLFDLSSWKFKNQQKQKANKPNFKMVGKGLT